MIFSERFTHFPVKLLLNNNYLIQTAGWIAQMIAVRPTTVATNTADPEIVPRAVKAAFL